MAGIRYSLCFARTTSYIAHYGIGTHLIRCFGSKSFRTPIESDFGSVRHVGNVRNFTTSRLQKDTKGFSKVQDRPANKIEQNKWIRDSIKMLCSSYRMIPAEELAAATASIPEDVMIEFCRAYASLRQPQKLQVWLDRLFALNINSKRANEVLWIILSARMWRDTQLVIKMMNENGHQINTDLLAECIASMPQKPDPVAIAALLSEDGKLINSSKLRRSIGPDIRSELAQLLDNEQVQEAMQLVMSYRGVHQVSLCLKLLDYALQHQIPLECLDNIVSERVDSFPIKDSKFVQAKLSHFLITSNFNGFAEFANDFELFSASPRIKGKPNYQNYRLTWRLLLNMLNDGMSSSILTSSHLREFAVSTTTNVALRPQLLAMMLSVFNTLPDIPAMITLLQYATEICGISIPSQYLQSLSSASNSPAIDGNYVFDHENWRDAANAICVHRNVDLVNVLDQSRGFRNQLCI